MQATSRIPQRLCVGCGQRSDQAQLLRWVYDREIGLAVDIRGVAGRGAWLHAEPACIAKAVRSGFAKSFKTQVQVALPDVFELVRRAASRRLSGLLHAAQSRRQLVLGADAVRELSGQVPNTLQIALLAEDTGSLAGEAFVLLLAARGKLVRWGAKHIYGQWLGRGEVAILAITEPGLAKQVAHTLALLRLAPVQGQEKATPEQARLPEDR